MSCSSISTAHVQLLHVAQHDQGAAAGSADEFSGMYVDLEHLSIDQRRDRCALDVLFDGGDLCLGLANRGRGDVLVRLPGSGALKLQVGLGLS